MKKLIILMTIASLMSCQDRVICPAFQSTYILDDSTRYAYFSYVWQLDETTRSQYLASQKQGDSNDTTGSVAQPKTDYYAYAGEKVVPWRTQKRTKYGIIKEPFYPIKNYQLRTAPMENVLAPEQVTNDFDAADFGMDSTSVANGDSIARQQVAFVEKEQEGPRYKYGYEPGDIFNVEQEYYNKYFGKMLVDNKPRPVPQKQATDSLGVSSDSVAVNEPFFKRLFKKKPKTEVEPLTDEVEEENPSLDEGSEEEESSEEGGGNG